MRVTLEAKQERIVKTLEGPLFVSAGAGSGKTFTLTQRVLYALKPGSKPRDQWADPAVPEAFLDSIDQVLAITFTDKAAQELKERIRSALREAGMAAEAEKVDNAWISTIHGMCSRIIRAHALDLDVDPAFTVAGYADDLKRRAVEHVLRRVAAEDADGAGPFDNLLEAFELESQGSSMSLSSLLSILVAILSKVSTLIGGLDAFEQVRARPSHIDLYEAYRDIASTPSYANCDAARTAIEALDTYLTSKRDLPALRACYTACGELSKRVRGMGKDEKSFVDAVRAARPTFFAEAYLALRADALDELIPLAAQVDAEYRALKHERSVLDNDDLLTLAYDALKHDPRVQAEFAGKFKMVMVDEFQDTAQQQVELVSLLCSPDARELCTVGDAQQSIYRFRGADVSVFRTKKDTVEASGGGVVCSLDVNYRSHADILSYADRIFEGGASNRLGRDFLHLVSCGEDARRGARALHEGTSRRQAVLVVGGNADARAEAKAAAIAARFKRLHDEEGFAPSDMVILMARLTKADVYANAVRAQGMPCVVSGGTSVFRRAPEVGVVSALLAFLANPDDGENGITPLVTSPMFGLGATELLALSTCINAQTGITDTRSITGEVLLLAPLMEEFGELPLLDRMRAVLLRAASRVGHDRTSAIVRDAVVESGWLARLEAGGAQEHAVAANVLKAIAIVEAEEEGRAYAPRLVARAFADHNAHVKESPATLSGAGEDAVRIMTVHASKGLEFPVVAVAECDGIRTNNDRIQFCDRGGTTLWCALPNRFEPASDKELLKVPELDCDEVTDVPDQAAAAFAYMRHERNALDYEEAARLLYVAITRAREVAILALGAGAATELEPGHGTSLVGEVLARILPPDAENSGLPDLGCDRLDFDNAHPGDFQMVLLDDLKYPSKSGSVKRPQVTFYAEDYPLSAVGDAAGGAPAANNEPVAVGAPTAVGTPAAGNAPVTADAPTAGNAAAAPAAPEPATRDVLLVRPATVAATLAPAPAPTRDSYSYTSMAAALHEEGEDRVARPVIATDSGELVVDAKQDSARAHVGDASHAAALGPLPAGGHTAGAERTATTRHAAGASDGAAASAASASADDPTALGSAFHAAAQWLIETGSAHVPAARIDALARYWGVSAPQRVRLEEALARWEGSRVRAVLQAWAQVRAEVPFFSQGMDEARLEFGTYAEGAIDVLATDPARPGEALVLDYKTGGSPAETPEELQRKHELQARVYADVLHRAGFAHVTLVFVRVEIEDPARPGEPQVVTYEM